MFSLASMPSIQLLPGERVLREGAPAEGWRTRLVIVAVLVHLLGVVLIPLLPLGIWTARRVFSVHRYWVTNRRVVVRTGLLGYELRSIPLSRVADVSQSSDWMDRMLGLVHLEVRDMTGESSSGGLSRGVRLCGVDDAEVWSTAILDRTDRTPGLDGDDRMDQVVALLQRIADRAA